MTGSKRFGYLVAFVAGLSILLLGCGTLWSSSQQTLPDEQVLQQTATAPLIVVTPFAPSNPQIRMDPTATPTVANVIPLNETSADKALSLLILHTSDTRGYVDPCG